MIEDLKTKILRLRGEILEFWVKCHVPQEERATFAPFYCHAYTETLVESHKSEVGRLKKLFIDNKKIYSLLSRRAELLLEMAKLEVAANDSNRLTNRGGHLLQEEKVRNMTRKVINFKLNNDQQ